MNNYLILIGISLILTFLFRWAFRTLPGERWQIMGVIPTVKQPDGSWSGVNLTYYGFFIALSTAWAGVVFFMLLGAVALPFGMIALALSLILAICVPASRMTARFVENKAYTASVGGAAFIGILISPWIIHFMEKVFAVSTPPGSWLSSGMAALAIAYAFGEGIGRLACISFGCCYGRPMDQIPAMFQALCFHRSFIFSGKTKKISYAHQLDQKEIFPVQAITAILYCGAALMGMVLFVFGLFTTALICTLSVTQLWRFFSEFFRADYRGRQKISAYQTMALASMVYAVLVVTFLSGPSNGMPVDLSTGLKALWTPWMLVFLQTLWILTFWYTGRSQVTGATITLFVNQEKI